ncbi:hypothetical protein CCUS01_02727 [Colletotrichum cuscutae]|uniref:Uncharacterized protein n=1 Tax=Colletotrichum cuscutae TaxID=1209917 RepID=A0AAJ0DNV9_9PEZI|nr:hypothetical protein CCUS01_02727 [Colletotrichum cuscutae]
MPSSQLLPSTNISLLQESLSKHVKWDETGAKRNQQSSLAAHQSLMGKRWPEHCNKVEPWRLTQQHSVWSSGLEKVAYQGWLDYREMSGYGT